MGAQKFSLFYHVFSPKLPPDTPEWHRARLTLAVSGLLLLFYFLPELLTHLIAPLDPVSLKETLLILSGTACLLLGFLLAKIGYVAPAVWFTVGGWALDVLLDTLFGEGMGWGASLEIWLIFGLLIAFLLLPLRQYLLFAAIQTIFAWLVTWLRQGEMDITYNLEVHIATVAMLGLGLWLREHEQRQREEATDALRKQKAYLQDVIDSIQAPFYVIDVKDYRIRLTNRAAREMGLIEDSYLDKIGFDAIYGGFTRRPPAIYTGKSPIAAKSALQAPFLAIFPFEIRLHRKESFHCIGRRVRVTVEGLCVLLCFLW